MKKSDYQKIVIVDICFRLLAAPVVLFQVWATPFNVLLDWFDGEFFKRAGYTHIRYTQIDKLLDYYWHFFILLYCLQYHVPQRFFFIILFLIRTFSQFLYFLTKKSVYFFLFPNVFEFFFFFYLASLFFPSLQFWFAWPQLAFPLILLTLAKLTNEYLVHLKKVNFSRFVWGKTTFWPKEKNKLITTNNNLL